MNRFGYPGMGSAPLSGAICPRRWALLAGTHWACAHLRVNPAAFSGEPLFGVKKWPKPIVLPLFSVTAITVPSPPLWFCQSGLYCGAARLHRHHGAGAPSRCGQYGVKGGAGRHPGQPDECHPGRDLCLAGLMIDLIAG